jgi:hypothetical protein
MQWRNNSCPISKAEVKVEKLTETGFQEDEPLWSDGFGDDSLETATVAVQVDEETAEVVNVL